MQARHTCNSGNILDVPILFQSPGEQQTQALMHEMAKMQEALLALTRAVHQQNRNDGDAHGHTES